MATSGDTEQPPQTPRRLESPDGCDTPHPLETLSGTAPQAAGDGSDLPLPAAPRVEVVEVDPDETPFGVPGPPMSRHAPFYRGYPASSPSSLS